ncbi:MAG: RlmE family RNA methyltransferase [Casimicrobiaceae bacterium]
MANPPKQRKKKNKVDRAWIEQHVNDPYVQRAARLGYRSRAAFKLLELAERDRLFRPGMTVVDLGSSPGSWCQVLRERLGPRSKIVAVDLLPMDGVAGVDFIQADFREEVGLAAVLAALKNRPVDLVVSDLAPNLSGIDSVDQARSIHLGELALEFAVGQLTPNGDFVVKLFQGTGLAEFQRRVEAHFARVYVRKPKASRDRSRELYVVAKAFERATSPDERVL